MNQIEKTNKERKQTNQRSNFILKIMQLPIARPGGCYVNKKQNNKRNKTNYDEKEEEDDQERLG